MLPRSRLLVLSALVACGGAASSITSPPPPPPPPVRSIARIELTTPSALVFLNHHVNGAAFVAKAFDADDVVVPNPSLTFTAPSGWTVRGDTLIAPAVQSAGVLHIAASMPVSGDLTAAAAGVPAQDSLLLASGIDLRAYTLHASDLCRAPGNNSIMNSANVFVDSVSYMNVHVDSVVYAGDSGYVRNFGGAAQLWWSGPMQEWLRDGTTDTITVVSGHEQLDREAPDTLFFTDPSDAGGPQFPVVKVSDTPLTFQGATWCSGSWIWLANPTLARGPVTIVATP